MAGTILTERVAGIPSEVELAYMAGIADGEGSFTVGKREVVQQSNKTARTPSFSARFSLEMTDEKTVREFAHVFDGRVTSRRRALSRRMSYTFHASDAKAREVAYTLLPYLRLKREQAQLIVDMPVVPNKRQKSPETVEILDKIRLRVSGLNQGLVV